MRAEAFLEFEQCVGVAAHDHRQHDAIGFGGDAMAQQRETIRDDDLPEGQQQAFAAFGKNAELDIHHADTPSANAADYAQRACAG
ncbi:hypothetical protein LYSHEL_28490 [Lysobacter helvus]|uniref:Uncharacterized protein n=2 Tax=Lysobacteraceae TaxID=32033 RepID=A0ABM7Q8R0_9GAMM|nr:hypothetical protein LYSCAS_28460 [Lysobacter caseinilyticus]BCT96978.1 hypothetical protein LYSHEL_28490 [Lysobacter helvus]